jgi:hypothetical protein
VGKRTEEDRKKNHQITEFFSSEPAPEKVSSMFIKSESDYEILICFSQEPKKEKQMTRPELEMIEIVNNGKY